jgi:putative colanic acid biosynthesis UDP-glucose lipid carrier transferase
VNSGITGLAQVNGCRGEVPCEEDLRRRIFWNLKYVESWSLGMDLGLIIRTMKAVFYPPETGY